MNNLIKNLTNTGYTDNGAVTNKSSFNPLVDFVFLAGASRNMSDADITSLIDKAYKFDREKTIKLIFWAGAIREGLGERRFFKLALNYLASLDSREVRENVNNIVFFSRWDYLFDLYESENTSSPTKAVILKYIQEAFEAETDGLLFKWLPREKSKKYPKLRKKLTGQAGGPKAYRRKLAANTKVVETQMSANKWNEIKYEHVPSKAMSNYSKAFKKHSEERFNTYLEAVIKGEKKINSSVLFPSDLVKASAKDPQTANAQWKALPDYLNDKASSTLVVCDVSASMEGQPMDVSIGLGIYLAERLVGDFKDLVCTFSEKPAFFTIPQGTLSQKIVALMRANWSYNTNLTKVFELLLGRAKQYNSPESEMPKTILIISDMEFDTASNTETNFEHIEDLFKASGYTMPKVVFWNVKGRAGNMPALSKDKNVQLISGYSPSVMKYVLEAEANPESLVESIVNDEKYAIIKT